LRLLIRRGKPTLLVAETEVIVVKTSNLIALILALLITAGGFEVINILFTHASNGHEQEPAALVARI
jgi:hypothetical protein